MTQDSKRRECSAAQLSVSIRIQLSSVNIDAFTILSPWYLWTAVSCVVMARVPRRHAHSMSVRVKSSPLNGSGLMARRSPLHTLLDQWPHFDFCYSQLVCLLKSLP